MRAPVRLLASFSRWTVHSRSPAVSCRISPAQHRRSHNGRVRTWNLGELGRVSKEAGPFVFHLPSDDPYLNLSIEHYLFSKAHPDSHILLFYTNRPCVVIGRNQNPWLETDLGRVLGGLQDEEQLREIHESQRGRNPLDAPEVVPVDLVRRRSGGGTVFHDSGNLNYSVITPFVRSWSRSTHAQMVVQALQSLKTATDEMRTINLPEVRVNDRNDIVMQRPNETQWLKISGSAYKLTKDRALHHGTLLYASPHIHRISDLLRSPGREFITAHGVESVRSKVGNLAWTPSRRERIRVKNDITEAIVTQFWRLYGSAQQREAGVNEITLSSPASLKELEEQNPLVAKGRRELTSPAWIFEQTPKFDFQSGMVENHAIDFHAVKGVLKQMEVRSPVPGSEESPGGLIWRQHEQQFGTDEVHTDVKDRIDNVKLYEVENWKTLVAELPGGESRPLHSDFEPGNRDQTEHATHLEMSSIPFALVKRLEAIFPQYMPATRVESKPMLSTLQGVGEQ